MAINLPVNLLKNRFDTAGTLLCWDTHEAHEAMAEGGVKQVLRSTERALEKSGLLPPVLELNALQDDFGRPPVSLVVAHLQQAAKRKRQHSLIVQVHHSDCAGLVLFGNDGRGGRRWVYLNELTIDTFSIGLDAIAAGQTSIIWPTGEVTSVCRALTKTLSGHRITLPSGTTVILANLIYSEPVGLNQSTARNSENIKRAQMSHLERLEAEGIHIIREVAAQADNPVMMYSVGKDSAVMLHLAKKAFYPSPPPFPLLHVDTGWKFRAMYEFRDQMAAAVGMDLIVHTNPDGIAKNINPFDHGSALHTDIMKTEGLKQALDKHGFDVAFGGARRDEEKSRAKERVFSFRTETHRWDPKNQRPELWNLYNGYKRKGESIRVFPLSNWTELDIWQYIYREQIPIVPLYFSAERPVVKKDGMLLMVDDDRMRLFPDEAIEIKRVRFRTLGCYPLTGAVESEADDLPSILLELLQSKTSERQSRAIDNDSSASMEKKKQEGYF